MLTGAVSTSSGASLITWTLEPVGSTPGSGGVVLQAVVNADQDWTLYEDEFLVDANFAGQYCSRGAPDGMTSSQLMISGSYARGWSAATGVVNYFDNVGWNMTLDGIQGAG